MGFFSKDRCTFKDGKCTVTFNDKGKLTRQRVNKMLSKVRASYGTVNVEIGEGVSEIETEAFLKYERPMIINIPASITSIGDRAFDECFGLMGFNVSPDNRNYTSIDGSLYSKDESILIRYAIGKEEGRFSVPEGVTRIGGWALTDAVNLTRVDLPESLLHISWSGLAGCTGLTKIYIPENVTEIESWAFSGCKALCEVSIPKSVTVTGYHLFHGCAENPKIYCEAEKAGAGWSSEWSKSFNGGDSCEPLFSQEPKKVYGKTLND